MRKTLKLLAVGCGVTVLLIGNVAVLAQAGRGRGARPDIAGNALINRVGLTPEQADKVIALRKQHAEERRQNAKKIREAHKEALTEIVGEEKLGEIQQLVRQRRRGGRAGRMGRGPGGPGMGRFRGYAQGPGGMRGRRGGGGFGGYGGPAWGPGQHPRGGRWQDFQTFGGPGRGGAGGWGYRRGAAGPQRLGPGAGPGRGPNRLGNIENLDPEQQEKVTAIAEAHQEKLKKEREQFRKQLEEVLTPEQMEQLRPGPGGRGPGPGFGSGPY